MAGYGDAPFGDLGYYFYADPTGETGWDVNDPNNPAYMYRVTFDYGDEGLGSPFSYGSDAKNAHYGEWAGDSERKYREEHGNDEEEDEYEDDGMGVSMSLEDRIRKNFEKIDPEMRSKLAKGDDLEPWELSGLSGALTKGVVGDTGGIGKGGVLVDPFSKDKHRIILWNGGPHKGWSGVGVPHGLYSIPQRHEFSYDRESGDWSDKARNLSGRLGGDSRKSAGFGSYLDGANEYSGLEDEYGAVTDAILDNLKDIIPEKYKRLRNDLAHTIWSSWLNGYLPSEGFFEGLGKNGAVKDVDPKYWKNLMHDNIVSWLNRTLRSSASGVDNERVLDKFRVIQAAVKLNDLVKNSEVREGKHSGQRDTMHELVAYDYKPFKDVGGYLDLVSTENGLFGKYQELRRLGADADEAWEDAFGDKLGDRKRLVSDREGKEVMDSFRKDIDDYMTRQNIVGALTRGPGE